MTPVRRTWLVILILIASFICFLVSWLLATGNLVHGDGYPEWIAGGFMLLVAALITERVPAA